MITEPDDTTTLTIASYNILHPHSAIKNREPHGTLQLPGGFVTSNWLLRAGKVISNIKALNCDLVCLQEASPATLRPLTRHFNLVTYCNARIDFETGAQNRRYGAALLTNSPALIPLKKPLVFKGPHLCARRAAASLFSHTPSGRTMLIVSLHTTGYPPFEPDLPTLTSTKEFGYQELHSYLQQAETYKSALDAIIIAGDFNEDATQDALPLSRHKLMESFGYQRDSSRTPSEFANPRKLDWIYVWSKTPVTLEPVTIPLPHPQASDHVPVATKIRFI